jgi:MFS family permease
MKSEESNGVKLTFRALILIGFFARLSYGMARTPLLALFTKSLGANTTLIGLVVGISTVTGIFFKAPAGTLSDLYGRRRILFVATLIFGLMPFTYILVSDYKFLIIIRFFHGFATAIYGPVAMAILMDISGERKGQLIGTYSSAGLIGGLIAAPLSGWILNYLGGENPSLSVFKLMYVYIGFIGSITIILSILLWNRIPTKKSVEPVTFQTVYSKFRSDVWTVLTDPQVLITSSMEGVQNLTVGALEAFLPIYVVTTAGLTSFHAGVLWGAQLIVLAIARPAMGRVSDRRGRKPVITAGMIICLLSFTLYPYITAFPLLVLLTAVFGLGESMVTSSTAALVAEQTKASGYGTSMGVFGSLWDIGHASGPILTGLLLSWLSYNQTFLIISIILLVATTLFQIKVVEPDKQ